MSSPSKKRGFRFIKVDNLNFNWRFDGIVDIRPQPNNSNKLIVDFGWYDTFLFANDKENEPPAFEPKRVSPSFIRKSIFEGISLGWDTDKINEEFHIKYRRGNFYKIVEPEFRCGANWEELAALFNYKIDENDQDWTYTIVEPNRIDEYIGAYDTTMTNEDTKFSLMEMIIQSLTEQASIKLMNEKWNKVKALLNKDFELHEYTIHYWCCWDNTNISDCWRVTPLIRDFWLDKIQ